MKRLRTVRDFVDLRALEQPDAPYLLAPETGAAMNYAALQRLSRELGAFLVTRKLQKGDKVALMLHNSYQTAQLLISSLLACIMLTMRTVLPPRRARPKGRVPRTNARLTAQLY